MKVGEFRKAIANVPDDFELELRDPNFGGLLEGFTLKQEHIEIKTRKKQVLLQVPFIEPLGE